MQPNAIPLYTETVNKSNLAADGHVAMSGMTVIDEYSIRNLLNNVANLTQSNIVN